MKNKNKIPYETIELAVNGDSAALQKVISHFRGYIRSNCIRDFRDDFGNVTPGVDEEMVKLIELKLTSSIVTHFKLK